MNMRFFCNRWLKSSAPLAVLPGQKCLSVKKFFFWPVATISIATLFCGCPLKVAINCDKLKPDTYIATFQSQISENLVNLIETGENSIATDEKSIATGENSIATGGFDTLNHRESQVLSQSQSQLLSQLNKSHMIEVPKGFIATKNLRLGKKQVAIEISANMLKKIYARFGEDSTVIQTIIEGTMAPLVTGEEMTLEEYREILTEFYGAKIADEILSGTLDITFTSPDNKVQKKKIPVQEILLQPQGTTIYFEY